MDTENKFTEELKHCYKWTINKYKPNTDRKPVIKSQIFITENNTKWCLTANMINIENNKIEFTLELIYSNETQLYIKFNLFNKSQETILRLHSSEQIISENSIKTGRIDFDLENWFCSDKWGRNTDMFVIYWEIIHSKSQPNVCQKVGNQLITNFKSMINDKKFSDVIIAVNGHEFMAHKSVLSARSLVFDTMFSSDMKEKRENRVDVNDIEVEVFQEFLTYLYTGTSDKIESIPEELLICAEKYGLNDLKTVCEEVLGQNLTNESAIDLLLFAVKYNANHLRERVINYIAINYTDIDSKCYNSLINLYEKEPKLMKSIVDVLAKINN